MTANKPLPSGDLAYAFNTSIPDSSRVPTFFDAVWVDTWPRPSDPPPADPMKGDPTTGIGRCWINRHYGGINMGFCDGSVRRVKLNELMTLKWSLQPGWPEQ